MSFVCKLCFRALMFIGVLVLGESAGAQDWVQQTSLTGTILTDVCFTDPDTGTAVGFSGTIRRTTDGGAIWFSQNSGTFSHLHGVHFADRLTGAAVGDNGTVLMTTDGGTTWVIRDPGTTVPLTSVFVFNQLKVITCGFYGDGEPDIFMTLDGGLTWSAQTISSQPLEAIDFADSLFGMVAGWYAGMWRTTDGGHTWIHIGSGEFGSCSLLDVDVFDTSTAGAVGRRLLGPESSYCGAVPITYEGGTFASLDGGNTWLGVPWEHITGGVSFGSSQTGTAVGGEGQIYRTTNGGKSWGTQVSGVLIGLNAVSFPHPDTGTVVGNSGTILRTTTGGGPIAGTSDDPPISMDFALSQNYPNPFNSISNFEFQIANLGYVTLKIYDLLGREIATVVNERLGPGAYTRQWDAAELASGVYVYRLRSGDFVQTRKLVLIR